MCLLCCLTLSKTHHCQYQQHFFFFLHYTAVQNQAKAHTQLCRVAYPQPADPDTLARAMSESMLSVSFSPSLLSIKKRGSSVSVFFVAVYSFQISSGNDIHHMTEGDFHLSCCAMSYNWQQLSSEKS